MLLLRQVIVVSIVVLCTAELHADAPPTSQPGAAVPAKPFDLKAYLLGRKGGMPSRVERLVVAGLASGVSVGAVAAGIAFGTWSLLDYRCLQDVPQCNKSRSSDDQISGTDFLRHHALGQQKALFADMAWIGAAAGTVVAVLLVVSCIWPETWWPFAPAETQ